MEEIEELKKLLWQSAVSLNRCMGCPINDSALCCKIVSKVLKLLNKTEEQLREAEANYNNILEK